jgi:hypothetical protein
MLVLAATNGTAARGDDYTAACPGERRPAAITPLPVENTLDPAGSSSGGCCSATRGFPEMGPSPVRRAT